MDLEELTRLDSPPEPRCAICNKRPTLAKCHKCGRWLCQDHVANLHEHVELNDWASCILHVEQVSHANINRWAQQWANFKAF